MRIVLPDASVKIALSDGRIDPAWYRELLRLAGAVNAAEYVTGTWTPVLTFDTPGDLSIVYSLQAGQFTRIGTMFVAHFAIVTSTFTHTTASGNLRITGLPIASAGVSVRGPLTWQGITKAGYTDIAPILVPPAQTIFVQASGSGVSLSLVQATDMPSGGTVILIGGLTFRTA